MQKIQEGKPYVYKCGGNELAKVLYYYGYIPDYKSNEYKIVCPFHNDLNPSMIIDLTKGSFFCFGCGASGDAFHFVEMVNKKDNSLKAMLKFLKILKSNKVEAINVSNRVSNKKQSEELYNIAYDYYYGLSNIDWENDNFEEVNKTREYMKARGFPPKILSKCKAKVTYNKQYAIIFPMFDNDVFKGWVCRTTLKDVEKKRKYLYNEGFMRRTTLVGNYNKKDYVFVVEGYMDRLRFVLYGIDNVVAILGWKMSKEQEMKLKNNGVKYIISALDNDECGIKGTEYLKTIFSNVTRFQYKPGIKDPGEMDKKSFKQMYEKTMIKFAQQRQQ